MTDKRPTIIAGMVAGLTWGIVVLWIGSVWLAPYDLAMHPARALAIAGFGPGVVMIAMVGRLAQRRFFDDSIIDGESFAPGSAAEIDQRVLSNTTEQLVLALAVWPLAVLTLGNGAVLALGAGFTIARVLFWIGYHVSPPLRGLGFAATFYPTVLAAIWTLWVLLGG